MRIMAGDARPHGVVRHRVDLRESRRPRRIIAVAERTITPLPRGRRLVIEGGFRVRGRRSVADFAGYGLMACPVVFLDNLRMARGANFVARVDQRSVSIGFHGGGPIVAELSKALGNQVMTRQQ